MPSVSDAPSFYIPSVDIGPFLADPASAAAEDIVKDVRAACKSTGFLQITGHGISKATQQTAFDAARRFFALPFDQKKKLDASKAVGHRGYDVLASQAYGEGIMSDVKEGYYTGIDIPASDPRTGRFYMGPNQWPLEHVLDPVLFQKPCEAYYQEVIQLSIKILELIARTLSYEPHGFDDFIANDPAAPMRRLHYPPTAAVTDGKKQFGASTHTDFGAITLLLQGEVAGLEVLDHSTDAWHAVQPNPDAYVVNIGDMLSMCTSNEYKSSVHRVINVSPTDRYSIVFFFDGNLDCSLAPLDGSEHVRPKNVEEHMMRRLTSSYSVEAKA